MCGRPNIAYWTLLDEDKFQQDSLNAHVVKNEFNASATHQPSMVHKAKRLNMMLITGDQDKVVTLQH